MSRDNGREYWNADLPKEHFALVELDQYGKDEGGLSRRDATMRIIVEWAKMRKGMDTGVWPGSAPVAQQPAAPVQSQPLQGQGQSFERRRPLNGNASAVELD